MILGITGHRPKSLYGYKENHPGNLFIINTIGDFFKNNKPNSIITGMAIGVDQWAAQWCIKLKIPFMAAIPFKNQERLWPAEAQRKYNWILSKAKNIHEIHKITEIELEKVNISKLMNERNEWIVNNSDAILGVFGGSPGGTRNCLEYAKNQNKRIFIINPGDYYKNLV